MRAMRDTAPVPSRSLPSPRLWRLHGKMHCLVMRVLTRRGSHGTRIWHYTAPQPRQRIPFQCLVRRSPDEPLQAARRTVRNAGSRVTRRVSACGPTKSQPADPIQYDEATNYNTIARHGITLDRLQEAVGRQGRRDTPLLAPGRTRKMRLSGRSTIPRRWLVAITLPSGAT